MFSLNLTLKYPPFDVRLKNEKGKPFVFDFIRKKWLVLTPEEWVRQHLVHYLINQKKYPASRIAIEKELKLNDTQKRFDIAVFDENLKPFLVVECKAPYIELDHRTIEQAQRYNLVLRANYIMISNGMDDVVLDEKNRMIELPEFPG